MINSIIFQPVKTGNCQRMRFIFILSGLIIWTIFSPVTPAAIIVTEPDGLGDARIAEGVEFSAYEIGNRWDMSDAADVVAKESGYLENQEFVDGVFRATTFDIDGFSDPDRKSTRLNSSHSQQSRMPSSA